MGQLFCLSPSPDKQKINSLRTLRPCGEHYLSELGALCVFAREFFSALIGENLRLISLESVEEPLGRQADGIGVEDSQIIGKDKNPHDQQEDPCGHMNHAEVTPKAL